MGAGWGHNAALLPGPGFSRAAVPCCTISAEIWGACAPCALPCIAYDVYGTGEVFFLSINWGQTKGLRKSLRCRGIQKTPESKDLQEGRKSVKFVAEPWRAQVERAEICKEKFSQTRNLNRANFHKGS